MIKKLLLVLLLAPLLFSACKKDDPVNPVASQFVIEGIDQVNLSTSAGSKLDLSISSSSGAAEAVSLSVTGLPTGVNAVFSPVSGTPPFDASVTFSRTSTAIPGTYPIKVVGTSASFTKSYDLNLVVPEWNGWTVDGLAYRLFGLSTNSIFGSSVLTALSYDHGTADINASITGAFPTADGTYTYDLFDGGDPARKMSVVFRPMSSSASYINTGTDNKTATMKVAGGKYSLSFPATAFSDGTVTKSIAVSVSEQ